MTAKKKGALGLSSAVLLFALLFTLVPGVLYPAPGLGPERGSAVSLAASDDGRWVWQNPKPQGNGLSSVHFEDARTGWAVGGAGTILKTTDGGQTWDAQTSGTEQGLSSVFFVNFSSGWAVGGNGTILRTSDGGAGWSAQASGTSQALQSVDFVNAQVGWAVGENGVIVHTTDGGTTWTPQDSSTSNSLRSVDFVDGLTGWAVGDYATILHTTDGGMNWNIQPCSDCINLHPQQVVFVNSRTGWIATGQVALKTTDGGATWSRAQDVGGIRFSFPDQQTGWALAYESSFIYTFYFVFKTSDGGVTWTRLPTYLPGCAGKTVPCDKNSLFATDSASAWVVGGLGSIFHTGDGGAAWSEQSSAFTRGIAYSVSFADALNGWVVGADHNYGWVLKTSNGGVTWSSPSSSRSFPWLNGVDFVNTRTGWAVGGGIWKTSDGGETWTAQSSGTTRPLLSIAFVDERTGWAVGMSGTILKTADGGETWTAQAPGLSNQIDAVSFVDSQTGWATGPFDTVLHTTNGGANWYFQRGANGTGDKEIIRNTSVFFIDALTGWVTQSDGTILKTVNGGGSWTARSLGAGASRSSIFFVDANSGWVVGATGIWKTADGGETWARQLAVYALHSLSFSDARNGWAVGDGGAILRFTTEPIPTLTPTPTPSPTPTPAIPNLSVTKLATKDKAFPGDPLTYLILLDNSGQEGITVSLTDTIPSGTSLITETVSGGAVYSPTINSILWSGTVPPGGSSLPSQFFSFRTAIDSEFSGGAVTNTVRVSDGAVTTGASAKTDVRRWTFLPLLTRGAAAW